MTDHLQQLAEALGDTGAKYKCQDHLFNNVLSDIQKLQRQIAAANKELTERRRISGADAELSDHDRAEVERCRREVYAEEYEKIEAQLAAHPLKLKTKGEHDFILEGADEFWVEIGNIVVYVRKTEDAVTVDLTPKVSAHETLDCCSADFGMAKEFECTKCGKYNNDGEGFNGLCSSCADKEEALREEE